MKHYAIIVAGGSGTRFGSSIPKQFLPLCGRPVLMRTIEQFLKCTDTEVVVVLPASMWAMIPMLRVICRDTSLGVAMAYTSSTANQ